MGHLLGRTTRNGKKVMASTALFAMVGLLILPIFMALPVLAGGGGGGAAGQPPADVLAERAAAAAAGEGGEAAEEEKVETGRDVYYKIEALL